MVDLTFSLMAIKNSKTIITGRGYGGDQNVLSTTRDITVDSPEWIGNPYGTGTFTNYGWSGVWNGSMFIAVGRSTSSSGYSILRSYDGVHWTVCSDAPHTSNNYGWYRGICWDGAQFVAVGYYLGSNPVVTSPDGITWTGHTGAFSQQGNAIAWDGSQYVAVGVGTAGTIRYSSDALTWYTGTGVTFPSSSGGMAACWNGSLWVIGGQAGSGANVMAYSSDGQAWTGIAKAGFIGNYVDGIAWNGSVFVAVGTGVAGGGNDYSIGYSSDGMSWTGIATADCPFGSGAYYSGVCWNGSVFVAVGSNWADPVKLVAISPDGVDWAVVPPDAGLFGDPDTENDFATGVFSAPSAPYIGEWWGRPGNVQFDVVANG